MPDAPDIFKTTLLKQVQRLVKKDPSKETYVDLLLLGDPELDEEKLFTDATLRKKAFQTLEKRIHPDKHTKDGDTELANAVFKQMKEFVDVSCKDLDWGAERPSKRMKLEASVPSAYPEGFHVSKNWGEFTRRYKFRTDNSNRSGKAAREAITNAINLRGCLWHQKSITWGQCPRAWGENEVLNSVTLKDHAIKNERGQMLTTTEAIKEALTKRGPVISTSFRPPDAFVRDQSRKAAFVAAEAGANRVYEVIIMGWRLGKSGEEWLIKNRSGDGDISVAMHQFGIDSEVLEMLGNYKQTVWEPPPYLYRNDGKERKNWSGIETSLTMTEFETIINEGLDESGSVFALRGKMVTVVDPKNKCESRRGTITDIRKSKKRPGHFLEISLTFTS